MEGQRAPKFNKKTINMPFQKMYQKYMKEKSETGAGPRHLDDAETTREIN